MLRAFQRDDKGLAVIFLPKGLGHEKINSRKNNAYRLLLPQNQIHSLHMYRAILPMKHKKPKGHPNLRK